MSINHNDNAKGEKVFMDFLQTVQIPLFLCNSILWTSELGTSVKAEQEMYENIFIFYSRIK